MLDIIYYFNIFGCLTMGMALLLIQTAPQLINPHYRNAKRFLGIASIIVALCNALIFYNRVQESVAEIFAMPVLVAAQLQAALFTFIVLILFHSPYVCRRNILRHLCPTLFFVGLYLLTILLFPDVRIYSVDEYIANITNPVLLLRTVFAATYLTVEERKQKRRTMVITVGISILIMAAIILAITLIVSVQTAVDNRNNEVRTVKVLEELQSAIDGEVEPLGDQSEYYNFADMVNRAKESFPGETVYYKLVTTDEYVSLIITTEKKKNVYFDRYTPVDGKVGDEDVAYKLEISMVSDAMQPDDILHNYTGILKQ